ncbi:MAG: nicotinate-nucleotide--dimethylbenzimidazole phosphoribosyltransferase, partial [Persicimonas sp.]
MSYSSFDIEPASQRSSKQARDRLNALAKPPGSLGRLEEVAVRLAGMQRRCPPRAGRVRVVVFAASHGVASHHRVSAYPSEVTASMVGAFCRGQAAVNVLAERSHIPVEVVDVGVEAIVSSDLQRAVQTAEILEDQLGRPRHETRLLREMHFGDWEMSTWASIEHREPEAYQAFMEDWIHTAAPGGESFRDLCTRVEHFWAEHAPG